MKGNRYGRGNEKQGRRVRFLRSFAGAFLALLYAGAFVYAYIDYRNNAGTWLADLLLVLVSMPFVLTMRFLAGGSFDYGGADTVKVIAAALFCCALVWVIGAALEYFARALVRSILGKERA